MPRTILLLAVVCLASACQIPTFLEPAPGALRVRGVVGQGDLVLDAIDRGPVQSVQLFGGLAPGAHVIELRRDGVVVAAHVAEVRPGMVLDTRIDAPIASPSSAPIVSSTERARNTAPHARELDTTAPPGPDPIAAPTPDPIAAPARPTTPDPIAAPTPDPIAAPARPTTPEPIAASARPTTSDRPPRPADRTARSTHPDSPPATTARRASSSDRRSSSRSQPARDAELDDLLLRAVETERAMRSQRDAEREAERAREIERARERERAERAAVIAAQPEQPSRADVARAVQSILPDLARCAGGETGVTLVLRFEIDGETGRSRRTSVVGRHAGTPTGACMEAIGSIAFFGYFRRPTAIVSYPIRF